MAETDVTTNITPLHPDRPLTSTERSRRHRDRKRKKVRRVLATQNATLPVATGQRAPATLHQVPQPPTNGHGIGLILMGTAACIASLAIVINAQTGWRFGTTPVASVTFAGLSVAADILAIVLPTAAVALWWNRRWTLSVGAWATWALAASMATLASIGFSSLHMGDTAAARSAPVSTAVATADQRNAAIEAARAAAQAATVARQGECSRRGPLCRDRERDEKARMTELAAAIAVPVPIAPTIQDADPQITGAVRLAQWAGLSVKATDIGNLRLVLMALLPNLAGLVLAFGSALRR